MTDTITIGASDVPAILGLSPWQTASAVWARLRGLTTSEPTNATRRGHTLELGILLEYADRLGKKLYPWATSHRHLHRTKPPFRPGVYRGPSIEDGRIQHPTIQWAGCRPDGIVLLEDGSKHLVEVKTTRSFRDWEDADGKPILPPHYVVQVQWQLWVMGLEGCDVEAFCVSDDSRRSYRVPFDPAVAGRVVRLVTAWVARHIIADELPDDLPAEIAGLVWPAPREPESWLDATAEDRATMLRYDALGAQVKELEAERDACKDKLVNRIQDHTGIDGLCSWRATKRGRQFRSLL
jgi:hypothetical protein